MSPLTRLLAAGAVGLATAAGFMAMAGRPAGGAGAAEAPQTSVMVIREAVPAGQRVPSGALARSARPAPHVPAGAVADPAAAAGRVARVDLLPGEVLLEARLFPPGRSEDAPQVLPVPAGKRAVTVAVDEVVGVAGFVMPGTDVDVIGTLEIDGQTITRVILQRIGVLAIAQDAKTRDDPEAKVVSSATLAVTPHEAQILILVADRGKIRLAMRSPREADSAQPPPLTPAQLLGRPPAAERPTRAAARPAPALRKRAPAAASFAPDAPILVIRGTQAELVSR